MLLICLKHSVLFLNSRRFLEHWAGVPPLAFLHQLVHALNRKQPDGGSGPVSLTGRFSYASPTKDMLDLQVRTQGNCTPPYLEPTRLIETWVLFGPVAP